MTTDNPNQDPPASSTEAALSPAVPPTAPPVSAIAPETSTRAPVACLRCRYLLYDHRIGTPCPECGADTSWMSITEDPARSLWLARIARSYLWFLAAPAGAIAAMAPVFTCCGPAIAFEKGGWIAVPLAMLTVAGITAFQTRRLEQVAKASGMAALLARTHFRRPDGTTATESDPPAAPRIRSPVHWACVVPALVWSSVGMFATFAMLYGFRSARFGAPTEVPGLVLASVWPALVIPMVVAVWLITAAAPAGRGPENSDSAGRSLEHCSLLPLDDRRSRYAARGAMIGLVAVVLLHSVMVTGRALFTAEDFFSAANAQPARMIVGRITEDVLPFGIVLMIVAASVAIAWRAQTIRVLCGAAPRSVDLGVIQVGGVAALLATWALTGGGLSDVVACLVGMVAAISISCVIWPLKDVFAAFRPPSAGGRDRWWTLRGRGGG